MEDQRFDELTRRLVRPITRRQAFKTLMAAAMSGLIIRSGGGKAFAQKGGTAGCPQFCNQQFGPGSARGKCKSDAAQGGGLCYQCGPGSNSCGLSPCNGVCCAQGASCSNGTCACPTGQAVCGAGGAACFGVGTCTDLTTIQNCGACGNACASGQTCSNGRCTSNSPNPECVQSTCANPVLCRTSTDCVCMALFGGTGGFCAPRTIQCNTLSPCAPNGACPAGQLCAINSCCNNGNPVCVPTSPTCPPSTILHSS
jgi:hypothetical protein